MVTIADILGFNLEDMSTEQLEAKLLEERSACAAVAKKSVVSSKRTARKTNQAKAVNALTQMDFKSMSDADLQALKNMIKGDK